MTEYDPPASVAAVYSDLGSWRGAAHDVGVDVDVLEAIAEVAL